MPHIAFMATHAALIGLFLALLWQRERKAQLKLFLLIFFGLVGGGLGLAWLMYFVPSDAPEYMNLPLVP